MAERMLDLGGHIELWKVHVDELREQDLNAQVMPKSMFERLSATIGKDGRLESLPFCAKTERGIEIVSGHHRVRAARGAGVTEIFVLVDVSSLTLDQIRAKQLAHNAIHGESNEQLVKKIYEAIQDVELRLEAYIDPAKLNLNVEKISVGNVDLGLDFKTALVVFLPYEKELFEKACEKVVPFLTGDLAAIYMAELALVDQWKKAVKRVGKEYDIRAIGTQMAKVAEIVLAALGEEQDSDGDEFVAMRDLFGTAAIPMKDAEIIEDFINRKLEEGSIGKKERWKAVVKLIAEQNRELNNERTGESLGAASR